MSDVVFHNARVLTLDPQRPEAEAIVVRGDRFAWVGNDSDAPIRRWSRAIDCGGATVIPGLTDSHIHLLAYAASLRQLDCGRSAASSIGDLQRLIREHTRTIPTGDWVRARGYDDFYLSEGRQPTRDDLDKAASRHPVRLDHRSGHGCVLNSLGLELVGVREETPDPVDGVIDRDEAGRPTGLLLEMGSYISERMEEHRDAAQIQDSVAQASTRLLRWGITSVHDASPDNDLARWGLISQLEAGGAIRQRVVLMPGIRQAQRFVDAGLGFGAGTDSLRVGHAKLVVTLTTGSLQPSEHEIRELVEEAHRLGFPVAVHAVEEETILATLEVFMNQTQDLSPGFGASDRIEHCSEATPAVQALLERSGIAVVTQPGFIYESGERYIAQVPAEMQPWLYPLRALQDLGVNLAGGSDAPVASPNPWPGLYGAVTRRSASGATLREEQRISLEGALRMYMGIQAYGHTGIRAGEQADLVLLDRDVTQVRPEELIGTQVVLAMIGGELVPLV